MKKDKKRKKKKNFREKKKTSNMMKEMQALVDELKKKDNNNQGGFQKRVWCGQCRTEGHTKEECTTPPTCAICVMYNHTIINYQCNMKNRVAEVHQVEAHEGQPQMPPYRGKGRGRYYKRGQGRMNNEYREREYECFYCQTLGHMSRDCPMRIWHQAKKRDGPDRQKSK